MQRVNAKYPMDSLRLDLIHCAKMQVKQATYSDESSWLPCYFIALLLISIS